MDDLRRYFAIVAGVSLTFKRYIATATEPAISKLLKSITLAYGLLDNIKQRVPHDGVLY